MAGTARLPSHKDCNGACTSLILFCSCQRFTYYMVIPDLSSAAETGKLFPALTKASDHKNPKKKKYLIKKRTFQDSILLSQDIVMKFVEFEAVI